MNLHAGAAGIGENHLDSLALEGFDENVAAQHGLTNFGAGSGFLLRFNFRAHVRFDSFLFRSVFV